jgi:hypothetical protein
MRMNPHKKFRPLNLKTCRPYAVMVEKYTPRIVELTAIIALLPNPRQILNERFVRFRQFCNVFVPGMREIPAFICAFDLVALMSIR